MHMRDNFFFQISLQLFQHKKCHEFDLCGSLRWPPEGTLTWVLTFPDSISHTPRTETNHLHRCLPSTALLKQHFHSHSLRSLVFASANISKRFPCVPLLFLCMILDFLRTADSLPPALVTLPSGTLIVLLPALTPARYYFCLCFTSDRPAAVVWPLPVWPWSRLLKWICKWIHTLLIRHYKKHESLNKRKTLLTAKKNVF